LLNLKKCYSPKSNFILCLNTWNMTSKNTWRRKVPHYQENRLSHSFIRFFNHLFSYILIGSSTETWSHRTCWLVRTAKPSN
jgi:hypothetical protein